MPLFPPRLRDTPLDRDIIRGSQFAGRNLGAEVIDISPGRCAATACRPSAFDAVLVSATIDLIDCAAIAV
jgi:hypothetical protein